MIVMLIQNDSDRSNDHIRDANSNCELNYDGLKQQCDKAMDELTKLKKYIVILMSNLKNNLSSYHTFCFINTDNMEK